MNIFQWSAGDDGSNWWRFQTPGHVLTQLGHTIHHQRHAIPSLIEDADTIIGTRIAKPGPSLRWQTWAQAGKHLILDFDDNLDVIDPTSTQAHAFYNHPDTRRALHHNMAIAARITAATERIADWASAHNPNVVVIPNGLPAALLPAPRPLREDGRVVVGWAGSTHTLAELDLIAPALKQILDARRGKARIHIVGIHPDQQLIVNHLQRLGLNHPDVTITPWLPPGAPYLAGCDFDIWCAPYRDTEFNRNKFPTKWLEALFRGVPIVASRVGAYSSHVHHGRTGYLVHQPYQWARYIQDLIDDHRRREDMSAAAAAQAVAHIAEGYGPAWEQALQP